jgi:A/G-specific adenine glycosylase
MNELHERVLCWYDGHARNLPWRAASATPWAVMVSEFMLQQTPVARVLPVYEQWMERWPAPADLAAEPSGEAVRAWGRLGYPRRALRLHQAAAAIVAEHDGAVPPSYDALRALPGIGDYTAAAVASFAFGQRHPVLDTNVRRVLGALVCTATTPRCTGCPVTDLCAWRSAGHPPYVGPPRRGQTYAGTDRQCRGRLLGVIRDADGPVHVSRLEAVWADDAQRRRCLASLLQDGLVSPVSENMYALP